MEEDLSRFKCIGCGACCRIPNGIVRVGEDEISRIAGFLGMGESEFISNETDVAPDRKGLILKSREDGSCVYLSEDNRCMIHNVKPDKCRSFPYEWVNNDSYEVCAGLRKLAADQF
jgi:Fe-S-cluster containining protein